MRGHVVKRREAERDVDEIAAYIALRNVDAAERFYDAVETALNDLVDLPRSGRQRPELDRQRVGIRSWPIRGFNRYAIFYRPIENGIEVIRVLHGAQQLDEML